MRKGQIMKKFLGGLKAAVCTAAAAAAALTMSGCTNYTKMLNEQPAEYISMAQENTMKAMAGNAFGEEHKILQEACENGSFKLGFEVEGVQFGGELYVSEKDGKAAQIYKLTGSEGTSAEMYLYAGKDGLKFGTNGNSGRHVYDVTFEGLAEKLAASVFAPDSGSEYAMAQEEYDLIVQYIEEMSAAMEDGSSEAADDFSSILENFKEAHPPVTEEKTDTDIGGETVSANVVTYSYTKEDIASLTEHLVDLYLNEYADEKDFEYYSKDEQKEQIMSLFDEMDSCDLKMVHYVNSKSHMLMMTDTDIFVTVGEETMCISADALYGADPENSASQSYSASISNNSDEYAFRADVARGENGSSMTMFVTESGEEKEFATLASSKDGEDYTITLDVPSAEISCKAEGMVKTDKKSFEITLDRVSAVSGSAEVSYLPKGVVTVEKGGTMPELDADKEFLDITEEELDTLLENIESDFTAVMEETAPGSAMGNYIRKSKTAQANANAKTYFTAAATLLVHAGIDDEPLSGSAITGSGVNFDFGGTAKDGTGIVFEDIKGYFYGEYDPDTYSVDYMLWSEEPIPDEMKHKIPLEEQEEYAKQGIYIGCYPLQ